jgi:GTPase SAR1 family protein
VHLSKIIDGNLRNKMEVNYMEEKIPILGLANAGKSSLIFTLMREFKSLEGIKPTKGIERKKFPFLGKDFILWDFGGQDKYRSDYKKKAESYFSDLRELIFVVDLQDQNNFNNAINYFQEIIGYLKEYSPNATLNVLLNKVDPGMELNENVQKLVETFSQKMVDEAKPLPVRAFPTSIFNPISVIRSFSKPLFGNNTLYDNFSVLFMDLINKKSGIEFIIILTSELLEIGNYFLPEIDQEHLKAIAQEIIKTFDDKKMKISDISIQVENYAIHITQFEAGGKSFYFTFGYDATKVTEPSSLIAESFNVLEDVKKFMKYF